MVQMRFYTGGAVLRVLAVALCVCVTFCFLPFGVFCSDAEKRERCEFSLEFVGMEEGVFEVVLDVRSDNGSGGALCVVRYDAERLILLSAGAECGGATFSFVDIGGEVRLLIDGAENIDSASVSLFFGSVEGACGETEVEVLFAEAYCFADKEIEELEVEILDGVVRVYGEESAPGSSVQLPVLLSWEVGERDGETVLSVSGRIGEGFFAAGVELFIVREDGSGEKMLVAGVTSLSRNGEFALSVPLGEEGWYAMVITPVAFEREGCVRGEKVVHTIRQIQ